jgi:hypothetical protein
MTNAVRQVDNQVVDFDLAYFEFAIKPVEGRISFVDKGG